MFKLIYRLRNHRYVGRLYLESLIEAEQNPSISAETYVRRIQVWSNSWTASQWAGA